MIRFSAVHQFSICMYEGDGISNSAFFTRKLLTRMGIESRIYAGVVDPRVEDRVLSYREYVPGKDQLLLIHHGLGNGYENWLFSLPDTRSMVYHNISPARFFDSSVMHERIAIGRTQLVTWQKDVQSAIAVSNFNRKDLLKAGYTADRVRTIPLLVDLEEIRNQPFSQDIVEKYAGELVVLFVGNFAPHKSHEDLIDCFYYFLQMWDRPARLVLVGGKADSRREALQRYISRRGLADFVLLTGRVSSRELYGWYRVADIYLSMSEHEGFGIPLVEAAVFDTPVVAFDAAAVSDTLGEGGLLVQTKDLRLVAALLFRLAKDESLRQVVLSAQQKNLARFEADLLQDQLADFLKNIA